jgi:hypothetical protein
MTDYDFYYPMLKEGPTKDYVDQCVREGKPTPSMREIEIRTAQEASAQYDEDERKRRAAMPKRDVFLEDILTDIHDYCNSRSSHRIREYKDKIIRDLNKWRNWS